MRCKNYFLDVKKKNHVEKIYFHVEKIYFHVVKIVFGAGEKRKWSR